MTQTFITGGTIDNAIITNCDVSGSRVTSTGSTTARTLANRFADVINAKDFGVVGDGVTDDTAKINEAILACYNAGGGQVYLPEGEYLITQIVIYRQVIVNGAGIQATSLKSKNSTNLDMVISEGFAVNVGTGKYYGHDASVPSWFGITNIRLNGNKENNTLGRGIAFYGCAQYIDNVLVHSTAEDGIFTEDGQSAQNPIVGDSRWKAEEEGYFGYIITRSCGGKGWVFHGPHNSHIGRYISGFCGDWGFYSENSAGLYNGGTDDIINIHVYATTTKQGIYLGAGAKILYCMTDGTNIQIANPGSGLGKTDITLLRQAFSCQLGMSAIIVNSDASGVQIGTIYGETHTSSTAAKVIDWQGNSGNVGNIWYYDNGACLSCLDISGDFTSVYNAYINSFNTVGASAITLSGTYNSVTGRLEANANGLAYTAGSHNKVNLEINVPASGTAVSGSTPGITDNFYIRSGGTVSGSTAEKKLSSSFAVDSTGVKTITIAHGQLYTPTTRQVLATLVNNTAVDDWAATLKVSAVDATNVTLKANVTTASATVGATAFVSLWVTTGQQ